MSKSDRGYVLHTDLECERLDRQADVQGADSLLRHINLSPGANLLDAGSGSGAAARLFASTFPDANVVGVDIIPSYVAFADRRASAQAIENVRFVVADLARLPFASGSFDVIWSQYVLFFLQDPVAVLSELARVTRPGGEIVVRTHERTMCTNYPEDARLQPLIESLLTAIIGDWRNKRLPEMFWSAGLTDVRVSIESDRLYTIVGAIAPDQRRNVEEVLAGPVARFSHLFGGAEGARAFLTDWLAYLDREDTVTATPAWVVRGRVP